VIAIDTVWTSPPTLARAAGQTLPYSNYEDLLSNANRLGGTDGDTKTGPYKIDKLAVVDQDSIFALQSTGYVAHGMTDVLPTQVFVGERRIYAQSDAKGGWLVQAVAHGAAAEAAVHVIGYSTLSAAGKGGASAAHIVLEARRILGTSYQSVAGSGNVLAVRNNGQNEMIVEAGGNLYMNGSTTITNFDHHRDGKVARAIRAMLEPRDSKLRKDHAALITEYGKVVEDARLVAMPTRAGDPPMANLTGLTKFTMDALYQLEERIDALEAALAPANGGGR
jgi:hypothetical protein